MDFWRRTIVSTAVMAAICATADAQSSGAGTKQLTVERIYSQPSLGGQLYTGFAWTGDGKTLSYIETKGHGKASAGGISLGARRRRNPVYWAELAELV